jgi:hypothetical protein
MFKSIFIFWGSIHKKQYTVSLEANFKNLILFMPQKIWNCPCKPILNRPLMIGK